MKAPGFWKLILIPFLCLLGSFFWSELYFSQSNIFAFKEGWHIYTQNFLNPAIKAQPDFISRKLLSGHRLSSDFTSGVQRIISDRALRPVQWEVSYRLKKDGYIDVITGMERQSYRGIRLSRNPLAPSMKYVSNLKERYLETTPVRFVPESGFGKIRGEYRKGLLFLTQGTRTISFSEESQPGLVGIQISSLNAEVFKVRFQEETEENTLDFIPPGQRLPMIAGLSLISFILILLTGQLKFKVSMGFAFLGAIFFLSDFYVFSRRALRAPEILKRFSLMEQISGRSLEEKLAIFRKSPTDSMPILCVGKKCHPWDKRVLSEHAKRVVIYGGSQSQLCCVTDEADGFTSILHRELSSRLGVIETLNISHHGTFRERLKRTKSWLENSSPDYLIVENMALPDDQNALTAFVKEWHHRTKLILLRTPQNIEKFGSGNIKEILPQIRASLNLTLPENPDSGIWLVLRNVPYFQKLRSESNYIFLDPNALMLDEEVRKKGMLWWDNSHLTAFGQEQLAIWLADSIQTIDESSSTGN